ncbi:septum site determining protein [Nocardioides humilatus]|uniref:Septum site determining protein n=1 Tax=Nocardioides humilatus TaxID=2607660 RepID=A0A5B1LI12_9ACTN|nr:septum site-determining protein Ssd [Nocardioides humilatus]KAA1420302.1 septum site determining protein [Nocardioides humilatus]
MPTSPEPVSSTTAPPPLFVTADERLIGDLLALAAAADVTPVMAREPLAALSAWGRAPAVLIGADLADAVAALAPGRRPHVYVLTADRAPDQLFRTALQLGAEQVVEVGTSGAWLVELLADVTEQCVARGRVIGVVGGSGGAGATTFACALGQAAARTGPAIVIDCDPQGPGLDRMLGLERTEGFRWDALCQTTGRLSARALRDALPKAGGLGVLSWYAGTTAPSLQAFAVREALSAARRGHETVVIDLPRSPGRLIDELAARCDQLVVVTIGSVLGVSAAVRMRGRFERHPGLGLVIRGESVAVADVVSVVKVPVLAQMRDQPRLDESLDLGLGPLPTERGPLGRAVTAVLGSVQVQAA